MNLLPLRELQVSRSSFPKPCGSTLFFFDITEVGETNSQVITITNNGAGTLNLTSLNVEPAVFTTSGVLPPSLSGGSSTDITLEFTPTSEEFFNGTLTINSDDPLNPVCIINLGAAAAVPTMGQWAFFIFGLIIFTLLIVGIWNLSRSKKVI